MFMTDKGGVSSSFLKTELHAKQKYLAAFVRPRLPGWVKCVLGFLRL